MIAVAAPKMTALVYTLSAVKGIGLEKGTRIGVQTHNGTHINIDVLAFNGYEVHIHFHNPEDEVWMLFRSKGDMWYLLQYEPGNIHMPVNDSVEELTNWINSLVAKLTNDGISTPQFIGRILIMEKVSFSKIWTLLSGWYTLLGK